MKIEQVIRCKGTILTGWLDFDVKVPMELTIVTATAMTKCLLMNIAVGLTETASEAKSGTYVGLLFRNISNLTIEAGDEVNE